MRLSVCLLLALLLIVTALPAGNIISGTNTCPSSGAKAVVSTQTKTAQFIIMAGRSNSGRIYVGGSNVAATDPGVYLNAGDSLNMNPQGTSSPYDLNKTYFACSDSADSIAYVAVQ